MNLVQHLKAYFKKKENQEETGPAPQGVCPNCWGTAAWEGEYYKFIKGENGNPSKEVYNSFVQDVARKLDKIKINENTLVCETCNMKHKSN